MKHLLQAYQFAFGCHHSRLSRVFTIKKRTYQVCLQCGQEFDYSWALMQAVRSSPAHIPAALPNRTRRADVPVV